MNAIDQLFLKKQKNILSIYFTAGYPRLDATTEVLHALINHGADMIEIGMPYSDPLADGPVIQHSSTVAIAQGMTIQKLFEQLKTFQPTRKDVPLVLMGYLNPVLQYGTEKFCRQAAASGISGIILPDLPLHIYKREYAQLFFKYGLHFIFLITPQTVEERILEMDSLGSGFLYAVSSSSVTGRHTADTAKVDFWKRLQAMPLKNPVLTGFGIRDRESFEKACTYTSGGIIGTAYIKVLEQEGDIGKHTEEFLRGVRSRLWVVRHH